LRVRHEIFEIKKDIERSEERILKNMVELKGRDAFKDFFQWK